MTREEQALVAAAYRAVEDWLLLNGTLGADGNLIKEYRKLTPSDAEAKLRELMMQVAEKTFIAGMNWQHDKYDPETDKPFDLIVDEVLNASE